MEQLLVAAKGSKVDIFANPSHRMSKRPPSVKSGEGLGFEDLGSSFSPPRQVVTYGKSSKGKSKLASRPHIRAKKPPIPENGSDDELLLSSQTSTGDAVNSPPKRVMKGKKPDNDEVVRVNGRVLPAHPDYKPSSLNAFKALRFNKNKKNVADEDAVPPPSSSFTSSQDLHKPISEDVEVLGAPPSPGSPSLRQRPFETSSTRRGSPSTTRDGTRVFSDAKSSYISKPSPPPAKDVPPPTKPRPRPRVVIKTAPRKRGSSPEATPRPSVPKHDLPLHNMIPERPTDGDKKRNVKIVSPPRKEPQEFPMSLQAKENVSDGAQSGDACSSKIRKAKQIPLPSPLRPKPVSRGTTFLDLSPLSSSNKGKARAKTPDEGDLDLGDGLGKHGGPKPFPMSSQMLASIDKYPSIHSPQPAKRASSDDSSTEQGRSAKKRKDLCLAVLHIPDYLHEPMEDDSIDLGYARDPSTMCPFCDEDWPSHPTPFLQHLLATARKKSVSDPRPRNRGGLRAPLTVYISVCQRHRFELHQLPIAVEKGWPKTINFTKVPDRVKKMKKQLEAIILDNDDLSDADDNGGPRGPRSKSVFWREVKKEVKKRGSRAVAGVKGQFASFEKTQPGYYGEQGSVIIHQTLFDLFPPATLDASLIAPLTPAEFIQRILVPEAAVRLIAQDLCVDIEDAIVTLRESSQYGVAMFPDTSESKRKGGGIDDDEMDVADRIVMERARARRKELDEEERVEKELMEEELAARRTKARDSRREKALERAQRVREAKTRVEKQAEVDTSDLSEAKAMRRMRQGTSQGLATDDSESDAMSVDSLTSRRSARIVKKGAQGDGRNEARRRLQSNGSDSDSIELIGGPRNKTRNERERGMSQATRVDRKTDVTGERKKPFGGSACLDADGEHEATPRPTRRQQTGTIMTQTTFGGSSTRMLPLQIARDRSGTNNRDGWYHSLRTGVPEDSDSDTSNKSRFVRPRTMGDSSDWLFTEPSSSDSP